MSSIAFCVYYANVTPPCHSANELFAPTIPRSQQGNRQQTANSFLFIHTLPVFLFCSFELCSRRSRQKQHVFENSRWGNVHYWREMECWVLVRSKRHSGVHLQQPPECKNILSFYNLFWRLKGNYSELLHSEHIGFQYSEAYDLWTKGYIKNEMFELNFSGRIQKNTK